MSESGVSNISIGLTGETKNKGILRFNNDANAFDVVNNDTGDINFILDAASNSGTGDIRFIKTTSEKMRLTNDGKLGIAITKSITSTSCGWYIYDYRKCVYWW